jgi:hypothetical protein
MRVPGRTATPKEMSGLLEYLPSPPARNLSRQLQATLLAMVVRINRSNQNWVRTPNSL